MQLAHRHLHMQPASRGHSDETMQVIAVRSTSFPAYSRRYVNFNMGMLSLSWIASSRLNSILGV